MEDKLAGFALERAAPVPVLTVPLTKETIGRMLGLQKPVGILATADEGFARAIVRCCPAGADNVHDMEEEPSYDD